MRELPGTFSLMRLMTLKTQLHVDIERLRELDDPDAFSKRWTEHLESIAHLIDSYRNARMRAEES